MNGPQVAVAWRLTPAPELIDLGDLPGGIESSTAQSVSADGSVIVGPGTTELGQEAWRWTAERGMVALPDHPGGIVSSDANAVSSDTAGCSISRAMAGSRSATATPIWHFFLARGISHDGRIVTGRARTPEGHETGIPLHLPPACDDGRDEDGDGFTDAPDDPGCADAQSDTESPACRDGLDNDGDGAIDFDGGASANGGTPLGDADPECLRATRASERPARPCGIGAELAALLLALRRAARRAAA
ncbi:MAG: hypothetical protein DCC71_03615 [Proteobacteria bacterium]|nr:MAG: hypothetical protein DCC71_03615 [Pseudomonadota bacterium]